MLLLFVLLFAVASPLTTMGVSVDLPKSSGSTAIPSEQTITVAMGEDGKIHLEDGRVLADDTARDTLKAMARANANTPVYLKASRHAPYDRVMAIMALLQSAGFRRIVLVATE